MSYEKLIPDFKRLADAKKLAHGYIFFGPGRSGKKTFASALTRYLEEGKFSEDGGVLGDAMEILPEKNGSLGIDRIRDIKNFLWQKPNRSSRRAVVIGGGEFLTAEAENALLKIAEEPPPSALLILLIDDFERLRPTLHSRFQKIFFARLKGETEEAAEEYRGMVRRFLNSEKSRRGAVIKEMAGDENFNLDEFLKALLLAVPAKKSSFGLWHAALELRRQANYFNLNPKLQLAALAEKI
jgi:DNA polymerase III delta prime subunit